MRLLGVLSFAAAAFAASCAGAKPRPSADASVWDARAQAYITPAAATAAMRRADYLLLGEKHDNPAHHRLQASLIDAFGGAATETAVAMEMLPEDRQSAVDTFFAAGSTVGAFAAAVSWSALGWPPFAMYAPIVSAAAARGYPIRAADVSRERLRAVHHAGEAAVPVTWATTVGLAAPLPATDQAALERTIDEAHCGYAPKAMLPRLVFTQRLRDATLASNLAKSPRGVLIAGAGHVQAAGVPRYLARLRPGADVVGVVFFEGSAEDARDVDGFDYVWPTAPSDDEDPCVKFRDDLRKMQHHGRAAP